MSSTEVTQPHFDGSAEIKPSGRIHLGRRLTLEQHQRPAPTSGFRFAVGLPEDGLIAPYEDPTPFASTGELPRQELMYELEDAGADLFIEDAGLTMSYGIFGAPGSGKTSLMKYLLRQILALDAEDPERRFGALILDPKAALIEDLQRIVAEVGRDDDLVILNAHELEKHHEYVNVIDAELDAQELARALVLAAQSAGVAASEAYWFGAWQNVFSAAIYLLKWHGEGALTLRDLVKAVLQRQSADPMLSNGAPQRPIEGVARKARSHVDQLPQGEQPEELIAAVNQIEVFYAQESDNVATVENIMTQAYGDFLRTRTDRYSPPVTERVPGPPFYDRIIEDGKIVLVSVSPSEPGLAKVLCTVIKNLFMQTMRGRLDRVRANKLHNFARPVVLVCDEYSQIASEIPGQVGDGDFFSIARAQGCMGLLATQSVNVLQASALKENWKSIFSNFGAKIFMRAVDNETVEEATKLAGETEWYETSIGSSSGAQGLGSSTQRSFKDRKVLPGYVLTQLIERAQGVVLGSLDGRVPATYFLQVPKV